MISRDSTSHPVMAAAIRYGAPATPVYQLAWGLRLFSLGRSAERQPWYDKVCDDLEALLGRSQFHALCQDLQDHLKGNGLWGPYPKSAGEQALESDRAMRRRRAGRRFLVCRAISEVISCISEIESESEMQRLLTEQAEGLRTLFLIENDGNHIRLKAPEVTS
jgi:hypothetical protein